MIVEGLVSEVGTTQKGTPKAMIGGTWYFGGRGVDFTNMQSGQKVIVEYTTFGDKNLRAVKTWTLAPHQPGKAETDSISPEGERAFCSNVIAHAISAGLIKVPGDILPWLEASKAALRGQGPPIEGDESIPFSQEEP